MKPFKFFLVTDTHYFEPSLGCSGEAFDDYMKNEMYYLAESSEIVKATFKKIAEDTEVDTVIIPGDLSKDGEKESHKSFVKELKKLKEAGKKVFVITAGHDYNDHPRGYKGKDFVPVEGTTLDDLYDLYYEFGYSEALSVDRQTLSYVAEVAEGVRMIAFNCDSADNVKGTIDERMLSWAKEQIDKAKEDGCFIFAINHYPIIPSVPVFDLIGDAHIKNWRKVASFLADNGVHLAMTGHMHIQSINEFYSESGNKFVDICTSCLVGSPAKYRKVTVEDEETVKVESIPVPEFRENTDGISTQRFFDSRAETAAVNRINRALNGGDGIVKSLKGVAKGNFNNKTLGQIGRMLCIKVDSELKDKKFTTFAGEIARDIFLGDQPYTKGTPEYETVSRVLKRFHPVISKVEKKLTKDGVTPNLAEMVLKTIGNDKGWSDNDAVIKLK
ncbi:MAG: metallophosphoesterase [Ruminococcaceae bacterium]|jgi:3',5'-cyclic AMP phosphodiesterase CpdA|nr:metallophosphoesterase [Oscillospiraceae bacterium]